MRTPPPGAGLGLKPQHWDDALATRVPGLWFEVHAENHMVEGGPRIAGLERVRAAHPVAVHGVGLSLGGSARPDAAHLARVATLVRRIEPVLVSEHLAWNVVGGAHLPDLLPVVRTSESLSRIAAHIDEVQQALGRPIAIENPAHYLHLRGHTWDEPDFLHELSRRTGCGLLLDLNNVIVSAHNLGFDPHERLARFPVQAVVEVHLAGHSRDPGVGDALLIDSHDTPVAAAVWALYERLLARTGPLPTLIERDGNVPAFDDLMAERDRAQRCLQGVRTLENTPA